MMLIHVLDIKDTYCYGPFETCSLSCCYCQMLHFVHEAALRNLPDSFWKDVTAFICPKSIYYLKIFIASLFFWKKLKQFKMF